MSTERAQAGGRWYTHVRRFPTLIGRTSDGKRIPGGPYTPTQLVVGAGVAWLASQTTGLWAQFGRVGNLVAFAVIVGVPVIALGKAPLGNRNPFRILLGVGAALRSPAWGAYRGERMRPPKPQRVRAAVVAVDDHAPTTRPPRQQLVPVPGELSPIQMALAGTAAGPGSEQGEESL